MFFLRPTSVSSTKSCPVNLVTNGCGVCHAAVVRSLMLQESENDRLHALRHASYPPKNNVNGVRFRHKRTQPRFTIGAGPDEELCVELAELIGSSIKQSCSLNTSPSVERLSNATKDLETINTPTLTTVCDGRGTNEEIEKFGCSESFAIGSPSKDDIYVGNNSPRGRIKEKDPKRRHTMDERPVRNKKPTYSIRPSTEMAVADQDCCQRVVSPRRKQSPVPVARDASLEDAESLFKDVADAHQLTLTEIHDICLMQSLTTTFPSSEETDSGNTNGTNGDLRSRQASGGNIANAPNVPSSNGTSGNATKSRHASSSANGGATNFDSGFSDTSNTAPYVSSADVTSGGGDSTTENLLADVIEFANSAERDAKINLPKPSEFGDGNPFMLFVCLTLLLQHRDNIMKKRMDFNEIAIYFDKLMKKHNIRKVLKRARLLFADYLKSSFDSSLAAEKEIISS